MIALPLLAWLLAAEPAASDPQAARRAALSEMRAHPAPERALEGADTRRADAAIEVCRERLARRGDGLAEPRAEAMALALLRASQDGGLPEPLARRALQAVAEARGTLGTQVVAEIARLAETGREALRADAAEVLGEIGGAGEVDVLARLATRPELAEAATAALGRLGGKGVAAAFSRGIADGGMPREGRLALLQAAGRRDLREASAAVVAAIGDPGLATEARKAALRVARPSDLPALRKLRDGTTDAGSRAALDRLIARLEKG